MDTKQNYKILVVDDEEDLCEILQFNLENEGFETDIANSSEDALKMNLEEYDFFILDIMMGKISGTDLAKMIKRDDRLKNKPIIFLTAKDAEMDKLIGFKIGADDYIVKPFSVKEVVARIQAIGRRVYTKRKDKSILEFKDLRIDNNLKQVSINNNDVNLTKKEFDVLYLLVKNSGRIFSREEILDLVWEDEGIIMDRTVDVNIRRIRKKIGEYGEIIKTRSGYGYYFDPEAFK